MNSDEKRDLLSVPNMIQIGSTGRNSGKTVIAKDYIARHKDQKKIYALKIITIRGARGVCQRGGVGCGICTSIDSGYELIEEKNRLGQKDTMALLKAGSDRVFLLKAFEDHLFEGFKAFLSQVPEDAQIVCESNSLRHYVLPGLFIMIDNQQSKMKTTAAEVYTAADVVLNGPEEVRTLQFNA